MVSPSLTPSPKMKESPTARTRKVLGARSFLWSAPRCAWLLVRNSAQKGVFSTRSSRIAL